MIQGSDSIGQAPSHIVQVDLILMNEKGLHEDFLLEFGEDEFAEFASKLTTSIFESEELN